MLLRQIKEIKEIKKILGHAILDKVVAADGQKEQ